MLDHVFQREIFRLDVEKGLVLGEADRAAEGQPSEHNLEREDSDAR